MRIFIISLILTLISVQVFSQDYTISGSVKDNNNGEDLIGVNITIQELSGVGATTNIYGFYYL